MKKVTMQDIANHLNISKNSVSQALRGKGGVSLETQSLIVRTAAEMGYHYNKPQTEVNHPSRSFVFLASDYTLSSGLLNRSFFSNIYISIEQEVSHRGWQLLLQPINRGQIDTLTLPACIYEQGIDGIILLSHLSDAYIDKLIETGIPMVVIDHHYPNMNADAVLTNNRFGAYQIVEHLIELGHTEIGFMGNEDVSPSYQERFEGYLLAFRTAGLSLPDKKWMFRDIIEKDKEVYARLEALDKQPTAWFCVNDGLCYYTFSYLQQKGYEIPKDISLCCYDNGDLSRLTQPKITTMDIPLSYYGTRAFEQLLWRIEHPDVPYQEILLPSTLLKRASTHYNIQNQI